MIKKLLGRFQGEIFAVLRIVAGFLFACHGAGKLFGEEGPQLVSLMGLAGVIEFFGGILIAIGLFASVAAFISSGLMAAAYFMAHFPKGFLPIDNGGELAVAYCFLFLYIAAHGAGKWSVAAALKKPQFD